MSSTHAQDTNTSVTAPGAKLEKLSGDFKFAEGATCDAHGNVFFTDQPNDRIMEWSVDGKMSVFMQPAGRANGMYFDHAGNLLACADGTNALWLITPDRKVTVLVHGYEGKRLNGPNDVWERPDGGLYFTDPFYRRDYWDHTESEQDGECVYFLSADRQTLKRVITDFKRPNGIVGLPDGKTLFVADIDGRKTWGYDIQPDGSLTNKRLAAPAGSDGMTVDTEGNLYLCGRGVSVFDKTGKQIQHIPVPENWCGNICFGGADKQTLFIAASEGFYSIRTRTRGANQSK